MIKQKNPSGTYRPSYDRTPRYTVKPVSYTHLDVYKRQLVDAGMPLALDMGSDVEHQPAISSDLPIIRIVKPARDVYKRQVHATPPHSAPGSGSCIRRCRHPERTSHGTPCSSVQSSPQFPQMCIRDRKTILQAAFPLLKEEGDALVLIKPQFELQPEDIGPGGIVPVSYTHLCA